MVELSSLFCGNISIRLDIFKRKPPHPFNFKKGQSIMPHFLWFTSQGASINYVDTYYRILCCRVGSGNFPTGKFPGNCYIFPGNFPKFFSIFPVFPGVCFDRFRHGFLMSQNLFFATSILK